MGVLILVLAASDSPVVFSIKIEEALKRSSSLHIHWRHFLEASPASGESNARYEYGHVSV